MEEILCEALLWVVGGIVGGSLMISLMWRIFEMRMHELELFELKRRLRDGFEADREKNSRRS